LGAFISAEEFKRAAEDLNASANVEIIDLIRLGVVLVLGFVELAAVQKLAADHPTVTHILRSSFKHRHRLIERLKANDEAAMAVLGVIADPPGVEANGLAVEVDITARILQRGLRGHALRVAQ